MNCLEVIGMLIRNFGRLWDRKLPTCAQAA